MSIHFDQVSDDDGFFSLAFPNGEVVYRGEWDLHQILMTLLRTAINTWGDTMVGFGFE